MIEVERVGHAAIVADMDRPVSSTVYWFDRLAGIPRMQSPGSGAASTTAVEDRHQPASMRSWVVGVSNGPSLLEDGRSISFPIEVRAVLRTDATLRVPVTHH